MGERLSATVLAILATLVLACGSTGTGSAGRSDAGGQQGAPAGDVYITADDHFGVNAPSRGGGGAGLGTDASGGIQLVP